jgi:hypothetical protein
MDRSPTSRCECPAAVRVAGTESGVGLSLAEPRKSRESGADAADRRAVLEDAVLWFAKDGRGPGNKSSSPESQAHSAIDAADGTGSNLSQAAHHTARHQAQDLPLFAAKCEDCGPQSGVVQRHHVRAYASRLHVPRRGYGLVQPLRFELAFVEHSGQRILSGSFGGRVPANASADLQHGSGGSVHESCLHESIGSMGNCDQHGRSSASVGQRLHRASVVERETRDDLPPRVRHRARAGEGAPRLLSLLLLRPPAPGVELPDASSGLPITKMNGRSEQKQKTRRSIARIETRVKLGKLW